MWYWIRFAVVFVAFFCWAIFAGSDVDDDDDRDRSGLLEEDE